MLLDTLLDLNEAFPDLENEYRDTKKNTEKAQAIVNNHISANGSPINFTIGDNAQQNIQVQADQNVALTINELKKLGVDEQGLEDLKNILNTKSDKATIGERVLKWLATISSKAVEKGIELKLPAILELITKLTG